MASIDKYKPIATQMAIVKLIGLKNKTIDMNVWKRFVEKNGSR